jgi:hypothetical protein
LVRHPGVLSSQSCAEQSGGAIPHTSTDARVTATPAPEPPTAPRQLDLQGQLDRESSERRAESARKARLGQEVQTYLVDETVYLPHTYLKKLREQAGLTQRDLSLAMGYRGHGTIAMAETGVRERTAVRAIEFLRDRFGIGVPALETTPSSDADLSCATVVV